MSAPIKIGVTGATGMVGQDMVRALRMEPEKFEVLPVTRQLADITDKVSLEKAFAGLDVVIHAAGYVHPTASRERIFSINYQGTRNAFEAARSAAVKQFIHISSLSTITGQGDKFDLDENAPLAPCGEAYADSKIEAERYIQGQSSGSGQSRSMAWTILSTGFYLWCWRKDLAAQSNPVNQKGQAMLVDAGHRETNVVYVGNLSRVCLNAILNEKAYGQVYNVTDGEKVSKKQLFDAIASGIGARPIKKDLPRWVVAPVCQLVSGITGFAGRGNKSQICSFLTGCLSPGGSQSRI
jgi:Nucleoside-diphosphate-sugar epimerases